MGGLSSSPSRVKIFFFSTSPISVLGPTQTHPLGTGALSPGVKQPVCEADHLSPTSVELKRKYSNGYQYLC
jgi:hypothetical protein